MSDNDWVMAPRVPDEAMRTAHAMYGDTSDWWNAVIAAAPQPKDADTFVTCSCHTERQREICRKRKECVVAYATGRKITDARPSPEGVGGAIPDGYEVVCSIELSRLRERDKVERLAVHNDSVWYWQGDGHDVPESLTCPVIMSAKALRALLATPTPQEQDSREGRCLACGRPTDMPCGGLDGNGLGCTNNPAAHVEGGARVDAREPDRYVVLKASGSRYAYVNDTQEDRTVKRYDIFKGDGWADAAKHAAMLNRNATLAPPADGEGRV